MHIKRLDVSFEVKKISEDDRFYVFEGYASTFGNIDRGNDRVMKGAFADTIREMRSRAVKIPNSDYSKLMPVLWQHQHDNPIGSFVDMKEDDKGLWVKGIMPKDDDLVKGRVIPQMRSGSVSDMSIGYSIAEYSTEKKDDMVVWNLEKLNLWETSLVTIPMNAEANVTGFKGAVSNKFFPIAEKGVLFEETDEKDAFLFSDDDGNKCQIAAIVDGELKAIPSLLFKAVVSLRNEKGFDAARDGRASLLEKYYEKLGLESPFKKNYLLGENEAETLTTRELEKFLFVNGVFSKEGSKLVASKLKPIERDADSEGERDAAQKRLDDAVSSKLDQILLSLKGN